MILHSIVTLNHRFRSVLSQALQLATVSRAGCRASGESAATTWCTARSWTLAVVQLSERVLPGTLSTSCSITSPLSGHTADEKLAWHGKCCVFCDRARC